MSVRVTARIRPILSLELEKDVIVEAACPGQETVGSPTLVRIPNPKNDAEYFSFQFSSVYDHRATQQEFFDNEVAPTVKHLFNGFDGGKSLEDRGVIPRMLSGIHRKSRRIEKETKGATQVQVSMSYYEIYNDRVYDLFEPPEKRTAAGLPIRDNNGKTVVVGLTERPCTSLKEFEQLYDQANVNRSTSATKASDQEHSGPSHAVLCVKVSQTTEDCTLISTASAIDLAGSEDNRRTENGKERMIESASINKSLFVLAQCVEAISRKQSRIPYRESKMTRILSLGQNNGLTIMILNLAPVRSYHLDTLSSLILANRTKKIEVREVENQVIFNAPPRTSTCISGPNIQRQPLRPLATAHNTFLGEAAAAKADKPTKAFSVYSDKFRKPPVSTYQPGKSSPSKRPSDHEYLPIPRPHKAMRLSDPPRLSAHKDATMSQTAIEALVERKVEEKLAAKARRDESVIEQQNISADVQRRLELLERRIERKHDGRAEGLQYLLMGKQHQVRGEDASALKMYRLALAFFPDNDKLEYKIFALQEKTRARRHEADHITVPSQRVKVTKQPPTPPSESHFGNQIMRSAPSLPALPTQGFSRKRERNDDPEVENFEDMPGTGEARDDDYVQEHGFRFRLTQPTNPPKPRRVDVFSDTSTTEQQATIQQGPLLHQTPRTKRLLRIVNTRDIAQIRKLEGIGTKRAETIVRGLYSTAPNVEEDADELGGGVGDGYHKAVRRRDFWTLEELATCLQGVGAKTVEKMRAGMAA